MDTQAADEIGVGKPLVAQSKTSADLNKKSKESRNAGNRMLLTANYIAFPVLIAIVWELLSKAAIFPPVMMPPLGTIAQTLVENLRSGQIFGDLGVSLGRVLKGYCLGTLLGVALGGLMGRFAAVNRFFSLVFNGFRQIPPLAWIPLLILWFGIGEPSKIVLITTSSFIPILVNTMEGIQNTPKGYLEVAKLYHVKRFDLLRKVYFPAAVPSIFVGLRLGAGSAWMAVVASEMIAAASGVGYRINDARNMMETDVILANIIVIGIIGGLMDLLLRVLAKRASQWETA